jgi:cobaltochelatase CobN
MILFLSTADTDILAAARARALLPQGFGTIGAANPADISDVEGFLSRSLTETRAVLVRLLGGRRAWAEGFDLLTELCPARGIPLLAFGGEAEVDAELTAASTVPAGVMAQALEYLRFGGIENIANLFRFVADTVLLEGWGFDQPKRVPDVGIYRPELVGKHDETRPRVGIVFYRAHFCSGNTAFVDALVEALDRCRATCLPVYCYSLRPDETGRITALELIRGKVDVLIVTVLASGGTGAADALRALGGGRSDSWCAWEVPALEQLDIPIVQAICATGTRQEWERSESGLSPLDAAMQVAIPEFDGRIVSCAFSFKEPIEEGSRLLGYRADSERASRVATTAVGLARLRRLPNCDKKVGIVLSSYPTSQARIGNAVGLDTPASAVKLLRALRAAGYRVDGIPQDGDALVRGLIAAGSYDEEFLSEDQMHAAQARLDVRQYERWYEELPGDLRAKIEASWGPPPGQLYVDGSSIVLSGVAFGNVFVCIQPPRGFGEKPIAIYHDPDLPPSHHYLACYWWLRRVFEVDALIHLGKHGTLEWLPGKSLALSASCAPDAVLGGTPLIYPFIVNDPGEGTQAKRRAHALIIDHLIPPMMRADTYDELARLEQLLDDYAQLQTLDPAKLPELRGRIMALIRAAELDRDLGLGPEGEPDDFDDFILHVDGYLCELKDLRIRDGLHVLGETPSGEQRLGLLGAILRVGNGQVPALRAAVADRFGLDERALAAQAGRRVSAPAALTERFPGPAATGADLLDRLEEATAALIAAMDAKGWDELVAPDTCRAILGADHGGVVTALTFAAREVVPRLDRTGDEVGNVLRALEGRYVPSGPSGSPTRGRVDVLPTGRNFYSVDPKALPSELAYDTGRRLADDLLRRFAKQEGAYPETVGIVVWGTSAMRTQGDDIGEVLALLGVRPSWDERSRRLTGFEVIPLPELGRPRIDVVIRISGFFRDAFPDLITLLDDAIRTVAALDEDDADNYVAKHARAERRSGVDERRATTRIFGSKPGAYGAGLLPLIDARNWRTDADLARVYEVWGGYAYGRGLDGVHAVDEMRANLSRVELAVKNVDNREHDIFDSDDYFQYHGGMIAAVRALTGKDPRAFIGDTSDPSWVKCRDLKEEVQRVFRARVVNPKWVASMQRHGYKGAFELSATVDYLFGYDATASVVDDWMYQRLTERYVFDEQNASFMRRSNPWALHAICERLLEAVDRGLWARPEADVIERLRSIYLALDGDLEEGSK